VSERSPNTVFHNSPTLRVDVDAVSGATGSSKAIIKAVENALQ